jgi:hypothetical protein
VFYCVSSLSIDYSDICWRFCSVLLCFKPIYWLCWLFRCFIVFWVYLLTLLTIPISVDTFIVFYYVLSLSIDFVDYSDICWHFWSVLLCFEPICWLFRCFIMFWVYLLTLLTIPMFYYVLSLSIDFVDYSDICWHFCSVLLCFESIYWLCWLFRYLLTLLKCFIMFWAYLLTLLTIPISVDAFVVFYYVLSLSIDFVDYSDICWHFCSVLLCFEPIYWTLLTIPMFYYVLSLSIDFLDFV